MTSASVLINGFGVLFVILNSFGLGLRLPIGRLLAQVNAHGPVPDVLQPAVAGYLARFKGPSRIHCESDLRNYLTWCHDLGLPPLASQRGHVELYVRCECVGDGVFQPKAHATMSGNSRRQKGSPCDPARSFITTSTP